MHWGRLHDDLNALLGQTLPVGANHPRMIVYVLGQPSRRTL